MGKHLTSLRKRYKEKASMDRPFFIDEGDWALFSAHVFGGRTLRELGQELGVSGTHLRGVITQVDRILQLPRSSDSQWRDLTPESPIEDLILSMRSRNTLRELGCRTVEDLLRPDFNRHWPRLGRVTRQEILSALSRHGLGPAPADPVSHEITQLAHRLNQLRERVETSFQQWRDQINGLEDRIRKLSEGGC